MEITARKRQLWSASSKSMFAGSGKSLELMNKGRGLNFSCLKHGTIITKLEYLNVLEKHGRLKETFKFMQEFYHGDS